MYVKGKTEVILTIGFNVRVKIEVREHYYSLRLTLISQTRYVGSIGQMKELEFIHDPKRKRMGWVFEDKKERKNVCKKATSYLTFRFSIANFG